MQALQQGSSISREKARSPKEMLFEEEVKQKSTYQMREDIGARSSLNLK